MASAALEVWRASRSLHGADKLATAMVRAGHRVGRDQVARLMRTLGIEGATRGRHRTVTTRRDPGAARHPDLIRRAWGAPTRPDEWWVADLTYVWALDGLVCTSLVTDVLSRRALGWRVSASRATPLVMSALEQALLTRRRHDARFSPKGAGAPFRRRIAAHRDQPHRGRHRPSIETVGDALDNALMESTIGLCKTELIDHDGDGSWAGRAEVETETASWVHWYSTTRIHHSITKMSPVELEALHARAAQEPAA